MESQLAALRATVIAGHESINRRIDEWTDNATERMNRADKLQTERHQENTRTLEHQNRSLEQQSRTLVTIESEVKRTNGRVTKLESVSANASTTAITLPVLRWYITCFLAGAAVILGLMKILGKA